MYGQDAGMSPRKQMAMGKKIEAVKTPSASSPRMCNMVGNKAATPGSAPNMKTDGKALTYNP